MEKDYGHSDIIKY